MYTGIIAGASFHKSRNIQADYNCRCVAVEDFFRFLYYCEILRLGYIGIWRLRDARRCWECCLWRTDAPRLFWDLTGGEIGLCHRGF